MAKLYELQWAQDGAMPAVDVNTTAPTLVTIIEDESGGEARAERSPAKSGDDTHEGMTPPPLEGGTLECEAPQFSARTMERSSAPRAAAAASAVDRNATTRSEPRPRDPTAFLVSGVVFAGAFVATWFFVGRDDKATATRAAIAPVIGPGAAGARLSLEF